MFILENIIHLRHLSTSETVLETLSAHYLFSVFEPPKPMTNLLSADQSCVLSEYWPAIKHKVRLTSPYLSVCLRHFNFSVKKYFSNIIYNNIYFDPTIMRIAIIFRAPLQYGTFSSSETEMQLWYYYYFIKEWKIKEHGFATKRREKKT